MATSYTFAPTATQAFTFQPTINGTVYACAVTWNLYGQRWYVSGSTLGGQLVFSTPLVPSVNLPNNVLGPFFPGTDASMVYYPASQQIVVGP